MVPVKLSGREVDALVAIVRLQSVLLRFPSDKEIGDELGVSESNATAIVRRLREKRQISFARRKRRLARWIVTDDSYAAFFLLFHGLCSNQFERVRDRSVSLEGILLAIRNDRRLGWIESNLTIRDKVQVFLEKASKQKYLSQIVTSSRTKVRYTYGVRLTEYLEFLRALSNACSAHPRSSATERRKGAIGQFARWCPRPDEAEAI
jgi:hypothetical protein